MKLRLPLVLVLFFVIQTAKAQVTLDANAAGNTYEDINAVLAPNYNVVEAPDCNHSDFGRHIEEVFDAELNTDVFKFWIHTTPDNDRCKKFDRQRNEIKTYKQSPDNLKATEGETVEYKWKFKLASNFQASSSFTHLHQIKAVGGIYASIPMIALTARKASVDRIELRYTSTNNQTTIKTAELDLFRGHWVEVTELITYGNNGSYSIEIRRVSNNAILLSYSNKNLDTWQDGADFARPKWGIYRSLKNSQDLKDEELLYANFSIEEIDLSLSVEDLNSKAESLMLIPNSSSVITIKSFKIKNFDGLELYNNSGEQIPIEKRLKRQKLSVSGLEAGVYFIVLRKNKRAAKVLKCTIK